MSTWTVTTVEPGPSAGRDLFGRDEVGTGRWAGEHAPFASRGAGPGEGVGGRNGDDLVVVIGAQLGRHKTNTPTLDPVSPGGVAGEHRRLGRFHDRQMDAGPRRP